MNQANLFNSPFKLSILDKCPVASYETPSVALANTLHAAQQADKLGYHRYWIAEHHNNPALASPSPEIVVTWIAAQTKHIRIGSGGVMLQHYSPYKVAENFNLLASLAPGRIDLGIGKAPGGLPMATRALQYAIDPVEKGTFEEQITQLDNWLKPKSFNLETNPDPFSSLIATPTPQISADKFLLGASEDSAKLAAKLNWNFVFAAHLNGDKNLLTHTLKTWKSLSHLPTIIAVQVIVAPTINEATALANKVEIWGVELENGQRVTVQSEAQAHAFAKQAGSAPKKIEQRNNTVISGTAQSVSQKLIDLHTEFGIDEFIIDTPISAYSERLLSMKLLATYQSTNQSTSNPITA